jgi:hypothetical protein
MPLARARTPLTVAFEFGAEVIPALCPREIVAVFCPMRVSRLVRGAREGGGAGASRAVSDATGIGRGQTW